MLSYLLIGLIPLSNAFPFSTILIKNELGEKSIVKKSSIKGGKFDLKKVLYKLRESDKKNAPKLIENSNGTQTIIYKKNQFQKNLTKKELFDLIENPKSFGDEQYFIKDSIEIDFSWP